LTGLRDDSARAIRPPSGPVPAQASESTSTSTSESESESESESTRRSPAGG
jgi:hypothetical protein